MDGEASWLSVRRRGDHPEPHHRCGVPSARRNRGGGALLAAAVVRPGAAHAAVVVESSARGELSCLGGSRGTFPLLVSL